MNRVLVEAWIEALESGDYRQGSQRLMKETDKGREYCCLGVLYEVAIDKGLAPAWDTPMGDDPWNTFAGGGDAYVPRTIAELVGLDENMRYQVGPNTQMGLSHMNDVSRKSFREIAQHLRKHLLDQPA